MCGRYTLLADELEILTTFDLDQEAIENYEPSYNIAPGQRILAIIHDGKQKRAGLLRWGLIPRWAKDERIGYKMINARSETAHQKPSFKQLLMQKRCMIIADSFYEWKKTENGKQPQRIQIKDRKLFAFAGLWDKWGYGDDELFTCTILTKAANKYVEAIHHRMPIILPVEKEDAWIKPTKQKPEDTQRFLQSLQEEALKSYAVQQYVNSAKHNDEQCIQPITSA
ncbi:SOS response-associated peptidase [Virgibacillus sp. AGTR]|uniref:Abasic site processing protein n=1 Tax=Virgibacillus salarius TaxID=447199 RepID=A0A941I969_9BACI|nr:MULTISPECIES: SOS response-associated peptidase [Bacillaceae]MBR7795228.1 SOS response-associated peptidase [Virgibacillus salarius]NAZ07944.1 hypothetical protein [Agaribacter marinus]MCC2251497.1 SOS response-associated peptidase [Virgibacillus sp. AGTR]MDY7046474.1 SOS response-associated peptidase [Virgibacillus sp. M23]QRZ19943.1 SOS response-associated peptidase [Virgibacillus sp. AGTR]